MKNPQCAKCIWHDQCYSASPCDDYFPAQDDGDDLTRDDEIIELHRQQYHKEWNAAIDSGLFLS